MMLYNRPGLNFLQPIFALLCNIKLVYIKFVIYSFSVFFSIQNTIHLQVTSYLFDQKIHKHRQGLYKRVVRFVFILNPCLSFEASHFTFINCNDLKTKVVQSKDLFSYEVRIILLIIPNRYIHIFL